MKILCIPVIFLIALTSLALHAYDSKMISASGPYDITVPDDFALIQEAIDASQPAQRIYVRSGIYREYLVIEKPVSIHTPLLMGLESPNKDDRILDDDTQLNLKIGAKMSKSSPNRCIFIHDTQDQIKKKISDAYCPPKGNPIKA